MSNNHMVLRDTCPACRSRNAVMLYSCDYCAEPIRSYVDRFYSTQGHADFEYLKDAAYVLDECKDCGLVYQRWVPDEDLCARVYNEWIDPARILDVRMKSDRAKASLAYAEELLGIINRLKSGSNRIRMLDFGMGWGEYCQVAQALGCKACGVEVSQERIDHARSQGIEVMSQDELPESEFDYIVCDQVLEHVPNPLSVWQTFSKCLREGGIAKIGVPDGKGVAAQVRSRGFHWEAPDWRIPGQSGDNPVSPLEHINCFDVTSLVALAESFGFQRLDMPLRSQYVCVPALDVRAVVIRYLKMAKRRFLASTNLFFERRGGPS